MIPLGFVKGSVELIRTDIPVVVHCHHDARSQQAVGYLRGQGLDNVRYLVGGIDSYAAIIDPTIARY